MRADRFFCTKMGVNDVLLFGDDEKWLSEATVARFFALCYYLTCNHNI